MITSAPAKVQIAVVGGGPAGAAVAIELARGGADVLLAERRSFPRPKVCGGCLGPRAMACLEYLGLDARRLDGAAPVERVRVAASGSTATLPVPAGVAVDRAALDHALLDLAATCGVDVRTNTRAELGDLVDGRRGVLLNDGVSSRVEARVVLRATGLPPAAPGATDARVGLGSTRHSAAGPATSTVWMATGAAGYVGMARFGDGRLNVAASVRAAALSGREPGDVIDQILGEAGIDPLGWRDGWTGTRPLRASGLQQVEERVLPVGDAAGFWEPFTGEGIGWSLEGGIVIAPAAVRFAAEWDPIAVERWARDQQRWIRGLQSRSRAVAAITERPRAARLALGILRRVPAAGHWLIPDSLPALGRA